MQLVALLMYHFD